MACRSSGSETLRNKFTDGIEKLTHFAQIESAYSHVVHPRILVHERSDRGAALPASERQCEILERAIVLLDRVLVLEYDGA